MTRARWFPYACIALAVLVANSPALLHLVVTDPQRLWGYMGTNSGGPLPGIPTADPSAGFLMQPLGHLVVHDWLGGHIPWWNPYEGIGVPLAADMQSGVFFPPTLLLGLGDGMTYLQVTLELIAGWCTFALLLRLGVGRTLATAGGVAFGLCGTFAWFAIEPVRVLSLLPLCLLGVERVLAAAESERRWGWRLLAVGLAGSFLAGFPETFLIDLTFVGVWALARLAGPGRRHLRAMVTKLVAAGASAVVLALPQVLAFIGYLHTADTGQHGGGGFARVTLPARTLAQLILPYSAGPVAAFHTVGPVDVLGAFWGNVGGYLDVTLLAGALVGTFGRRNRILRLALAAWIVLCLARTYDFGPAVHLLALVPGLRLTAFYRYADPTWELAAVVLAALGLDDIARHRTRFRGLAAGVAVAAVASVAAALSGRAQLTAADGPAGSVTLHRHWFATVSLALALLALATLLVGGWLAAGRPGTRGGAHARGRGERERWGRVVMAAAVSVEAVVLLGATFLSAPSSSTLDLDTVQWLQANLGTYRFATLGPVQPNYGSYYRLAEVNVNELPLPRAWTDYVFVAARRQHRPVRVHRRVFVGRRRSDSRRGVQPPPGRVRGRRRALHPRAGVRPRPHRQPVPCRGHPGLARRPPVGPPGRPVPGVGAAVAGTGVQRRGRPGLRGGGPGLGRGPGDVRPPRHPGAARPVRARLDGHRRRPGARRVTRSDRSRRAVPGRHRSGRRPHRHVHLSPVG